MKGQKTLGSSDGLEAPKKSAAILFPTAMSCQNTSFGLQQYHRDDYSLFHHIDDPIDLQ